MGTLRFNLHEGMAAMTLAQAVMVAPALAGVIEDYRSAGLTDREIVERIAKVINEISANAELTKGKLQ